MPVELAIEGADKFKATAKALRTFGRGDLRKELYAGLNRASKPLRAEAKQEAWNRLPMRGGLGERVRRTRLSVKARAGRNPAIRIVAAKNAVKDPASIDRGRVLHPTFGHKPYVLQQVKPGWFTEIMQDGAPYVREEMVKVIDTVAKKVILAMR